MDQKNITFDFRIYVDPGTLHGAIDLSLQTNFENDPNGTGEEHLWLKKGTHLGLPGFFFYFSGELIFSG